MPHSKFTGAVFGVSRMLPENRMLAQCILPVTTSSSEAARSRRRFAGLVGPSARSPRVANMFGRDFRRRDIAAAGFLQPNEIDLGLPQELSASNPTGIWG